MMIKDIKANNWTNTSEVTTLIAGDGVSITEDSNGNPIVSVLTPPTPVKSMAIISASESAYTLPTGITAAKFTLVGGGGGCGIPDSATSIASGGGSGAVTIAFIDNINSSFSISIGGNAAPGKDGNPTSVKVNGTTYIANGGSHGNITDYSTLAWSSPSAALGGMGGTINQNNNGSLALMGSPGQVAISYIIEQSSAGGSSIFGGAGPGSITTNGSAPGSDASVNSGSGGGGMLESTSTLKGFGAAGICIIEW